MGSALTKLTSVTTKTAAMLKENTTNAMVVTTTRDPSTMTEDNADILSLATSEGHRIALIHQAMPKITSSLCNFQEYADLSNACGMEINALIQTLPSEEQ